MKADSTARVVPSVMDVASSNQIALPMSRCPPGDRTGDFLMKGNHD